MRNEDRADKIAEPSIETLRKLTEDIERAEAELERLRAENEQRKATLAMTRAPVMQARNEQSRNRRIEETERLDRLIARIEAGCA